MRRTCLLLCIFALAALLCTASASAKMEVPGRTNRWVNDYAEIIDLQAEAYLEKFISSIEQKTQDPVEIIIATFKSIEGWEFSDFAKAYGEKWREVKRGRRDNGVVILVVLEGNHAAIGVGKNLKGVLTAGTTNGILRSHMFPQFSRGNYSNGIRKATEELVKILDEAEIPEGTQAGPIALLVIILLVSLIIAAIRFSKKR